MSEALFKALLYRAIRELGYIQELSTDPMAVTSEGLAVIQQGMTALGIKDLSRESLNEPEGRDA